MDSIVIRVRNRIAQLMTDSYIVCGNSDYQITLDLDAEWSDLGTITVKFAFRDRCCARHIIDVEADGTTCSVPVLEDVDAVEVGIYAGNIRTSTPARIQCARCITDGDQEQAVPEFDFYNTMLEAWACRQNGDNAGWAACMQELHDHFDEVYGAEE